MAGITARKVALSDPRDTYVANRARVCHKPHGMMGLAIPFVKEVDVLHSLHPNDLVSRAASAERRNLSITVNKGNEPAGGRGPFLR